MVTTIKIKNPIYKVKASFGYRLDIIRENKSITGKCLKTLCIFLAQEDILRLKCSRVLVPRPFFSLLIPPSMSRIVGGFPLQEVSGCPGRLFAIPFSFISEEVWCYLDIRWSAKAIIMRCEVS